MGNGAERNLHHIEPRRVVYDEVTRRRLEIQQQITFLNATLPPLPLPKEGYDLTPISFSKELEDDGATALFYLNDFMQQETHGKGKEVRIVTFVQPRTIQILDTLGLPYLNHAAIKPPQE